MATHVLASCVLLSLLLDVTVAMKCVLQSRQLLNPGWWNLYPLMKTLDATPYVMTDSTNGYQYYFNVCDNTNKCLNGAMAACQYSGGGGVNGATPRQFDTGMEHWGSLAPMTYIDMQHANSETQSTYDTKNPIGVKLTYHNGEGGRQTHILFPCDKSAGAGLPRAPIKNTVEGPALTYTIVFPSEYGCLLPHPPKIPQSLLGSIPLDHATELEYEECKRGSIWTHIWAVTTLFSMAAATYFWWKSSILEKEYGVTFTPKGGPGVVSYSGGAVTDSYQDSSGKGNANTDYAGNAANSGSWPPTSKSAGYHDL